MDNTKRMHLCTKTFYTSCKHIMFEEGKFYESRRNILYDNTLYKYSDLSNNIYRIYFDKCYSDFLAPQIVESIKISLEEAMSDCYIFVNTSELSQYNLTTYTMDEYKAIIRENKIDSILDL